MQQRLSWRGMRPFGPAVPVKPVRLQAAPESRAADAEMPGGVRQLPAVGVQHLDDSLLLALRQRRGTRNSRNEHRLTQLELSDAKGTEAAAERRQLRQQVARIRAQVERFQCLTGLLVRIHHATLGVEHDDALAEAVEK